ncbi:MAG: VanW family protein [bacterium]
MKTNSISQPIKKILGLPSTEKENKKNSKRWLLATILVAFFLIALLLALAIITFEIKYQKEFFPGSHIGDINLEGLNITQALTTIDQTTEQISKNGLQLSYQKDDGTPLSINPLISSLSDPDLSRNLLTFDNHKTIHDAFAYGRNDIWWKNLLTQAQMFINPQQFKADFSLDEATLKILIDQQLLKIGKPAQDAKIKTTWSGKKYQIDILPEQNGISFNYDQIITDLKNNLTSLKNNPIEAKASVSLSVITKAEAEQKLFLVNNLLANSSTVLFYANKQWVMDNKTLSSMLEFQKTDAGINIGLVQETFEEWLTKNVAKDIEIDASDARVEFQNGQLVSVVPQGDGLKINLKKTYAEANQNLINNNSRWEIFADKIDPKITMAEINNLGIKEIIGTGKSNFSGSPANRRHNIATGASKLHGVIIKPNEEFSLTGSLGAVDGTTGYLTEMVIKDNKTTPEFGGGLCQIATTIFRAAMASGLPITERRNHSYSVSYYLENGLPGTDATIYIPKPDVRFINDTGNYILIQKRIEGDNLYFDFWGTPDGRMATRTKPRIWNWVDPAPTKYVETTDLKPGEQKCTEKSHKGVSTAFDYTVTYASGDVKKNTFSSVYKPWQAVCLVGVTSLSSSTDSTINIQFTP